MSWAARLKRVFAIEITTCRRCGGTLRVIASIEAPDVIERILDHLGREGACPNPAQVARHRRIACRCKPVLQDRP